MISRYPFFSRKLEQGQPKSPRASFHAGFRNGGRLPTVSANAFDGLSLKKDFALTDATKAGFNAANRKTTNSALSTGGTTHKHGTLKGMEIAPTYCV